MFQVCIHGRGGQGVVTAAEMLARAAFDEGHQVQAIPSFGSERTGAPVVAYCRVSTSPIRTREPVTAPDAVIVQDPTLLSVMNPFAGMNPEGWALLNTVSDAATIQGNHPDAPRGTDHIAAVPADDIVREYLGRPIPSGALLGAFAALAPMFSLDSVVGAIRHRFSGKVAEGNVHAAQAAHAWVLAHRSGPGRLIEESPSVAGNGLPSDLELDSGPIGSPEVKYA